MVSHHKLAMCSWASIVNYISVANNSEMIYIAAHEGGFLAVGGQTQRLYTSLRSFEEYNNPHSGSCLCL